MSNFLNEKVVMQYYIEQIDNDSIAFLKNRDEMKADLRALIVKLMDAETMNEKIQVATKLWKKLFEASMSFISPDKRGYDKIFSFFDAYVEFEELIFASDSFYRDHTLHCIWVYFLGEYVAREKQFERIFIDSQQQQLMIAGVHALVPENVEFKYTSDCLMELKKLEEATRCVSALTHDLGYPLKKVEKINKSIKKVLPYFAVNNFDDFDFEYNNIQQGFIDQFIDLVSRSLTVAINLSDNDNATQAIIDKGNEILSKIFKTDEMGNFLGINSLDEDVLSAEDREFVDNNIKVNIKFRSILAQKNAYLNDFENYQHGIMSAFLLMKNLNAFQTYHYNTKKDTLNLDPGSKYNATRLLAISQILESISAHTSDSLAISEINEENYLTLIDELEEFSRISRASQNREYVKEFCESSIEMNDGWLDIQFVFNNTNLDNLNPEISFKGRCKRFLSLFDIPDMSNNLKVRVTVIGQLPTDQNTYVLEIARKFADIRINGESQNIPKYLKSTQFYTKEEYATL